MILKNILGNVHIKDTVGDTGVNISSLVADSRQAIEASLFAAIKGITTDGHMHITQAIEKGACAIICEQMPEQTQEDICYIQVDDTSEALGRLAANFYGDPSRKLKLLGVTGTNGKTTTVKMLYDVFTALGHRCGMISTIGNQVVDKKIKTNYTTPDILTTNQLLQMMVAEGCEYAFMEVSSHAMTQKRTEAIHFHGAIFTNITHDHLDYHKSFREYIKAKQLLFTNLDDSAFAVINHDDKNARVIVQNSKARVKTYSVRAMSDYKAQVLENSFEGLKLIIDGQEMWSHLSGSFNAYNILSVYASGRMLGKTRDELLAAISGCVPPEGRFDFFVSPGKIIAIVDYAHTPDALRNILMNIRELKSGRQRLFTVIGCGGNRDKKKRPDMAVIATTLSDYVFLTSDNPRFEDPEAIIEDMVSGLAPYPELEKKYAAIINRSEAIRVACITAFPGDIILVAGKGHEKYQEIKNKKIPFDDKEILKKLLNR